MGLMDDHPRSSSPAADTGSAAHHVVNLYHKGVRVDDAIADMRSSVSLFPLADLDEAEELFRLYTRDPRNTPEACIQTETQIEFTLDPHPCDETEEQIYFKGTTDQIRGTKDSLEVWDYKTGKGEGLEILNEHMLQLAGYSKGVETLLKIPVHDSGIIRARGYNRRDGAKPEEAPTKVFYHSCMTREQRDVLLLRVAHIVAGIRSGLPLFGPGPYCYHCPYGGITQCINHWENLCKSRPPQ